MFLFFVQRIITFAPTSGAACTHLPAFGLKSRIGRHAGILVIVISFWVGLISLWPLVS